MPEYVSAIIGFGIEPKIRTDIFGEEHDDAVIRFGKRFNGRWLSEANRHWLSWLYAVKMNDWPISLLDLVWEWGDTKSKGKDKHFGELVDAQRRKLKAAQALSELGEQLRLIL